VVEQTFEDAGTFYWRFIGTNAAGTCTANSDVYTVTIGTSSLVCPNVFSPGSSEGVNDVWKVSYSSIISFKCWIFNRWGVQICELNDPSQGWDGKYKGKLVDSGVYYYVIEAKGSDGKKYKLNGDINIIKYKKGTGTTTGGDTGSN
jgi:gliding motility-associated-like protein